jgi:hypothetical protein
MTDNQGLIPNSVGLPDSMLYNLKPSAGTGRAYRCSIQPTNKSNFVANDTCIMMIPAGRRNTYLSGSDSYLKFTVQNNDANNKITIDNNASCFWNRLDVFHASNLLESIQQYNVLYTYLLDFQLNQTARVSLSNVFGTSFTNARDGLSIDPGKKLTFCIPLLSGTVGLGLDKYLPVGALSDDIRLEFVLEANNTAVVYNNANATKTPWTVVGVELELNYIEISDESQSIVNSASPLNDTVFLHGNSWKHYVASVPASTAGTFSALIPARFASTKSIVVCPRRTTEVTDVLSYSLSSRSNFGVDTYWFRVGSALIPSRPITLKNSSGLVAGYGEGFQEIQKMFHALNHTEIVGACTFSQYNTNDVADANVGAGGVQAVQTTVDSYKNSFAMGIDLETYSNREDIMISGLNTLSAQTFLECNIGTGPATAYVLNMYANYDHILVKDQGGILSVRF